MKTYRLTAERDRFTVTDTRTGAPVLIGGIDRHGEVFALEWFGKVAAGKGPARRAAIEAMGTKQDRARAYWENEQRCARENGTTADVSDMA